MIQLNNILYKKLFSKAKWLLMDEDVAADAVNTIFLKFHSYTGTTDQNFNTWSTTIINNKGKDYWTKKKKDKVSLTKTEDQHQLLFDNYSDINVVDTFYSDKLKEFLSDEELAFMLSYCESKETKTNKEKMKFHFLKEKVLKEKKQSAIYLLYNLVTKRSYKAKTFQDIAEFIGMTSEAIRQAYNDKRPVMKKTWTITDL